MSRTLQWSTAFILLIASLPARPAAAQRGQFLENVIRTFGEAAVERERRKRLEEERRAQEAARQAAEVERFSDPRRFEVDPGRSQTIQVRSETALRFVRSMNDFHSGLDQLVADLRTRPAPRPLRETLPDLIELSAAAPELVRRMDDRATLEPVRAAYLDFDARWRSLAYEMEPFARRDSTRERLLRQLDRTADDLIAMFDQPSQFERPRLERNLIAAATYMQGLIDDLEMERDRHGSGRLARRTRVLMEQRLLEADNLSQLSNQEIVERFDAAATVEGGSRTLERRVAELSRRIQPRSFADRIRESASEVSRHAEHLHDELTDSDPNEDRLREEMKVIAEHWRVLSDAIDRLPRGRADTEIDRIRREKQELDPAVSRLAVSLLGE
ncbi:FUSC family protein [Roseimaritima sediminicola]|uniref:hypothetical protein n=1 Tax=Roseimaritima sediminicola TaxID=2662066 RepID=UPI0012982A19|nr:hypothetical protein [Roseimaritima sediminicola]